MLFVWNNKESWSTLTAALAGKRQSDEKIAAILSSKYEGVLVYHGCRTTDINSYYANGLQQSSSEALDNQARTLFLTNEFPEVTPKELNDVIAKLGRRDDGRIYACLDRRHLLHDAGHYLIYGSERLCAIGAALVSRTSIDYRQVLKRSGQPTLLHVALQWELVSNTDFEEFISLIAKNLSAINAGLSLPIEMFTFEWQTGLPSSAILTHEHPTRIADPLLEMRPYFFNEQDT